MCIMALLLHVLRTHVFECVCGHRHEPSNTDTRYDRYDGLNIILVEE